jgi:hypothetical protein
MKARRFKSGLGAIVASQGGTIELATIGSIDPAGDVWVANNWDSVEAATSDDPCRPISTQGGGSGFTVI